MKDTVKYSRSNHEMEGMPAAHPENYNFKKGSKEDFDAQQDSRDKLIRKIENLEYDLEVINDAYASIQRNYENVSRLLKAEKEREALNTGTADGLKEKISFLESELRMAEARGKVYSGSYQDLLVQIDVLHREKDGLTQDLTLQKKKTELDVVFGDSDQQPEHAHWRT
jgi:chromosome segregation ATPase